MIPNCLRTDGYKLDHRSQYPIGATYVQDNFTARGSRIQGCDYMILFGAQYYAKKYMQGFFNTSKEEAVRRFKRRCDNYLGKDAVATDHIEALYTLGYLPIRFKALPEGTRVPVGVPAFILEPTKDEYVWLVGVLETLLSKIWFPSTVATVADQFLRIANKYADETCDNRDHVKWQFHDFSARGYSSEESGEIGAGAFLLTFSGSDSLVGIDFLEEYYGADVEKELVAGSVPATEHSVMCMGTKEGEFATYERLINEVYPKGIVSIVSDTWDFWNVVDNYLPKLKDDIISRDGKVVIRPDSGDPVDIICGTDVYESREDYEWQQAPLSEKDIEEGWELYTQTSEETGLVERLWEIFGGTINSKGYKVLDPHIGAIYGDSITPARATEILERLKTKGFAASNIVFGPGAYNFQYITRDTLGCAIKATFAVVNGEERDLQKAPKTDSAKTSAKGEVAVLFNAETNKHYMVESPTPEQKALCCLKTIFEDGILYNEQTYAQIKERVHSYHI